MELTIDLFPHVYPPQKDTFLLLDFVHPKPNDVVLELCTGCGIIALHLAQIAKQVVATDLNPHAVANARHNTRVNTLTNVSIQRGDLYKPVANQRFNLIVANPRMSRHHLLGVPKTPLKCLGTRAMMVDC